VLGEMRSDSDWAASESPSVRLMSCHRSPAVTEARIASPSALSMAIEARQHSRRSASASCPQRPRCRRRSRPPRPDRRIRRVCAIMATPLLTQYIEDNSHHGTQPKRGSPLHALDSETYRCRAGARSRGRGRAGGRGGRVRARICGARSLHTCRSARGWILEYDHRAMLRVASSSRRMTTMPVAPFRRS